MSFKIEYQYICWKNRDDENGSRWWVESENTFRTERARDRQLKALGERYTQILFRPKGIEPVTKEIEMSNDKTVIIYTDGSANWKDQLGGIGVYMRQGEYELTISRGYSHTTNNRMELRAIIEAMKEVIEKNYILHIYSDSEYCINVFTNWVYRWRDENYVGRKNVDLLKEGLIELEKFPKGNVIMKWCKGHNGIPGNEIADILAGEGRLSGEYIRCRPEE